MIVHVGECMTVPLLKPKVVNHGPTAICLFIINLHMDSLTLR